MPKIFIIDDWLESLLLISTELKEKGFEIQSFSSGEELLKILDKNKPDLFLIDINMPGMNGFELLDILPKYAPGVPSIMMTGIGENVTSLAVKSLKNQAVDFIEKTEPIEYIINKINAVLEHPDRHLHISENLEKIKNCFGLISVSRKMNDIFNQIEKIALTDLPVLVVGETGVGKELIARAIHSLSYRSNEIFMPINCGAIVDTLAESELFGYEKGSFTGASRKKQGLFKLAEKGTLFLDEITESNQSLQVKLLRALDPGEYVPIGGVPQKVLTRIIASTNRVDEISDSSTFRKDLFYRFEACLIKIPSLNERPEDIIPLAQHFLRKQNEENPHLPQKSFERNALLYLEKLNWPGNIRELKGFVNRLFIFSSGETITQKQVMEMIRLKQHIKSDTLHLDITNFIDNHRDLIIEKGSDYFIKIFKKEIFEYFLNQVGGNKSEAARLLKMETSSFRKALKKLLD